MSKKVCPLCLGERHLPTCSEMSFPSGRRRDDASGAGPAPQFDPTADHPQHSNSPISDEMSAIFAGLTEAMIERHIAEQRRQP